MQRDKLLGLVRCPEDHSELTFADPDVVSRLNVAIRRGRMVNRGGRRLHETIDAGLVRSQGDLVYPVIHGIPLLLRDEAIAVNSSNGY